ncbi:hypothetical protein PR08_gp18 [Idiomarinaceae phage Phi1M2-2]|uniref:hypothetical protein n=1 Tax=Idiomarinaceae phage Phi1M2-2 TaxID=1527515 RepID=UPI0004F70984|nr:hypothetical protein PR08_gp18 [Idiomarinaceae phage Phi1M2-2]AIM40775.1 hypothetical protein M22_018 [Idiomarinaceae phage Phi1M2-2]
MSHLFHVYNKLDSMDLVHVSALTEQEAIEIAKADGYLTNTLDVQVDDIVAFPFSSQDQTSDFIRRLNSAGVECEGCK